MKNKTMLNDGATVSWTASGLLECSCIVGRKTRGPGGSECKHVDAVIAKRLDNFHGAPSGTSIPVVGPARWGLHCPDDSPRPVFRFSFNALNESTIAVEFLPEFILEPVDLGFMSPDNCRRDLLDLAVPVAFDSAATEPCPECGLVPAEQDDFAMMRFDNEYVIATVLRGVLIDRWGACRDCLTTSVAGVVPDLS